jgi:oligopeptide transport system substrate-binding protein
MPIAGLGSGITYTARGLLFGLTAMVLAACSMGESNVESGNREGILHFGNGAEPQSLDPHVMSGSPEVNIANSLFEGLVTRNPYTMEIEPGVAQRWEFSEDRRVLTFHLNPAARWSNGDPVTARDFEWSLRRALHPALGNQLADALFPIENAQAYHLGEITDAGQVGVRALDEQTLEITLTNPAPYFMDLLASYVTYPVHRATLEDHGDPMARFTPWTRPGNMVSNGPFVLTEWRMNRRVTVEKNPTYWNADKVRLNGVVFHPVENEITQEHMFRVGQLHYTDAVPLNKIPGYQAMPDTPYEQAPMLAVYYFVFNTGRAPVDEVRVRRALALAIDREKLVSTVLQGTESASSVFVPPHIPGYRPPAGLDYDPDEARRLLARAGYPGGMGWPGLEFKYNTSDNNRKIAVAVQQMWKDELNIEITLANLEWKVFLDTLNGKNFQAARAGWVGGYLDPNTFLGRFITGGGTNRTGFSSTRFDEIMLRLAPEAQSAEERLQLMREAETILLDQVPIVPIYTYTSKHLVHASVRGAPANVLDTINYRYVWLDPDGARGED